MSPDLMFLGRPAAWHWYPTMIPPVWSCRQAGRDLTRRQA